MIKFLYILLLGISFGVVHHVNGDDFLTIQSAIDYAEDNDTVLVSQGVYYENLDINKTITLSSLAIYDDLSNWYEFDNITEQNEIINDNILNTIIDASNPLDSNFTSGIVVRSSANNCISPVIMGFTIRNGMGTMVTEEVTTPDGLLEVERKIGGGLFSYLANINIHHNKFLNNGGNSVEHGGAISSATSTDDWGFGFDNMTSSSNLARCEIDQINVHDNFFRGNDAIHGNTFSDRTFTNQINFSNSIFDVYNCSGGNITDIWLDTQNEADVEYENSAGDLCSITNDVWVSPSGSDVAGLATEISPIKSIKYALEIIAPTDNNPINIYIQEGLYTPLTTNETFPINMISNVNLIGTEVEIDASSSGRVIIMKDCQNSSISDIILNGGISGGYSSDPGGGIYLSNSNPVLTNLIISNNQGSYGGGMYLDNSNPTMTNVLMLNNVTFKNGGGMYLDNSNPVLTNVTILNSIAYTDGGGMYLDSSNPTLTNVTISDNIAWAVAGSHHGGAICSMNSNPILINVTISKNTAQIGAGLYLYESNPIIINSIIWDNMVQSINLDSGEPIVIFSNLEGGWTGDGNIETNPIFSDPDNQDFVLEESSPCIDTGTAYFELNGEIIVSLDESEYYGIAPDMGANEYNPLSNDISNEILPVEYSLKYPHPNPFNPVTTISFSIPEKSRTSIKVFDINGNLISTLLNESMNVGHHQLEWNAIDYPSGVYFVNLNAGKFMQTQKLMLVK